VAWVEEGEWLMWRRGTSLLHMIPNMAGLNRDPLYSTLAIFVRHIEHNCTLNGLDVTLCTPDFFCWEQN
jgi:hypothetical protein